MNRLHSGLMSMLACCLMVVSSGCMISPENDDTYFSINIGAHDRQFSPAGFVRKGGVDIEVQAYNYERGRWDTVATSVSKSGAMPWEGYNWHYWQTPKIRLGRDYWDSLGWGDQEWYDGTSQAKIRALGDGDLLYTFNDWRLDIPLRDLIRNVNGTEVRLSGWVYE